MSRAALVVVLAALAACNEAALYEARVRRTSYGVAHIQANDFGGLGFGEGYAQAEDHFCSIADQMVLARGERARYLGPGDDDEYVISDAGVKALGFKQRATQDLAQQPDWVQDWYRGFVAGLNNNFRDTGSDNIPGWCKGATWLTPIEVTDLVAYHRLFTLSIPYKSFAGAQPPGSEVESRATAATAAHGASNGWAIGKDRSESGRGMLLANPHYPWVGALRFWEKHLTIPGELDVYGMHILGAPGVAIGFTEDFAWTHTVSAGQRSTKYELNLVPGKPTAYRYDGAEREMDARTVEVEVLQGDGSIGTVERTVYFSHYGPILDDAETRWTGEKALTIRDANWDNDETLRQWLEINRAANFKEFQATLAKTQGIAWLNTIAVSVAGRAWYVDSAATPNLPQPTEGALDGSDPAFEWRSSPDARDPGVVAFKDFPSTESDDHLFNSNDSFWLTSATGRIEGDYSALHGKQRTARGLRTRNNALTLANRAPGLPAGEDGKFSLDEMVDAVLSNWSLAAHLVKPELVERCRQRRDLQEACEVLANWDDRFDLDSPGAVLFREFITQFDESDTHRQGWLFRISFDPDQPLETPRGLALGDAPLLNLERAVQLLETHNVPLDATLRDLQYAKTPVERVPIHGGHGAFEGVLNMQQTSSPFTESTTEPLDLPTPLDGSRYLSETGYRVVAGTSYLMAVELTAQGPRAQAILTYSQSGDPGSEHYLDQTRLFSQKRLRPVLFDEAAIAEDVVREYTVRSNR